MGYFNGQNWITYNTSNSGLLSDNLVSITIAPDSTIWTGYLINNNNFGISIFDGLTFTNHSHCDLPMIGNLRMKTFPDGKIYMASDGLNIIAFDMLTPNPPEIFEKHINKPFPNPGSGNIIFRFYNPVFPNSTFCIYDICGRQVFSMPVSTSTSGEIMVMWDTESEHVPPGIYFYTLSGENIWQSGKVVVQR